MFYSIAAGRRSCCQVPLNQMALHYKNLYPGANKLLPRIFRVQYGERVNVLAWLLQLQYAASSVEMMLR